MLAVDRSTAAADANGGSAEADRCRFQASFEVIPVPCEAFQSMPFVAATSYGKPLGTHTACAHLQVGELRRNQFYPRCGLGSYRERLRWVAKVGPGEVEVVRSIQADFEAVAAPYRQRLVAAKAAVLAESPSRSAAARRVLADLLREFTAVVDEFVIANTDRIAEIGLAPAWLDAMAADSLSAWQTGRRLDLPGVDEQWSGRVDHEPDGVSEKRIAAGGVVIGTSSDPPALSLTGQIDESNLTAVIAALTAAQQTAARLTVDLSGVTFCSVGGLRHLVKASGAGGIIFAGVPDHLARAFSAAGFAPAGATS